MGLEAATLLNGDIMATAYVFGQSRQLTEPDQRIDTYDVVFIQAVRAGQVGMAKLCMKS